MGWDGHILGWPRSDRVKDLDDQDFGRPNGFVWAMIGVAIYWPDQKLGWSEIMMVMDSDGQGLILLCLIYSGMFRCVPVCSGMFRYVLVCSGMFRYIPQCFHLPRT